MVCEPGHEKVTFQPFVAAVPEFATVKPSWKPPLHELASDQLTVQPPGAGDVPVAVGVGVGVGVGVVTVGVGVGVGGGLPLPFVRTTIDSAGTETELPDTLLEAMLGLALS